MPESAAIVTPNIFEAKEISLIISGDISIGIEGKPTPLCTFEEAVQSLTAAKVTIAAKTDRGELVITCADKLTGPFNMPIIVRATSHVFSGPSTTNTTAGLRVMNSMSSP